MDSRQAQSLLPDYTAGCLCEADEAAVRKWIEECPDCQKEWHAIQTTLLVVSTASQPLLSAEESRRMWECCANKIFEKREAERLARQNPSLWSWIRMQPRWGWAALGGAVAILGSVWLLAPAPTTNDGAPAFATASAAGDLKMFRQPPAATSGIVNHHAGTAMDPFTDHVGSTLVSASATAR
jgi:anti-sigma factor RsiW